MAALALSENASATIVTARALAEPPMVCHAPATFRRLRSRTAPAFDLLELYAFTRPASFCLPTAAGLAAALGLALPAEPGPTDLVAVLARARLALLRELSIIEKGRRRVQALAQGHAARGEQSAQQVERLRQPQGAQREAARVAQLERHAQHGVARHADQVHHARELGVGAHQDVLAVVERVALGAHTARAAARHRARFEDRHGHAALRERDRSCHAGVAGAHDGHRPRGVRPG